MSKLNMTIASFGLLAAICFAGMSGCGTGGPEGSAGDGRAEVAARDGGASAAEPDREGHGDVHLVAESDQEVLEDDAGHHHEEGGDLDRTPGDLFASRCEHDCFAYQCDECRYEVGVVKVPADLVDGGLVETAEVSRRNFGAGAVLTGEISFDERRIAHLSPRLPGIVQSVFVDLGQSVDSGAPLIEIDSPELAEAQADYLKALGEHKLAKRNFDRQRALREEGISSEREFFEAGQALETAEIRSNSGRQKLLRLGITDSEIAELESSGIEGATGRYLLKAPFSGDVLELHAVRGEQVELDRDLALFGSTATLWVWVDLYETYLRAVAKAQRERPIETAITVHAYPDETFEGKVDFIGSTMSEDTRTVKARVTLDNEEGKLRPGMFASVSLLMDDGANGLAIPSSAVLSDEGKEFVFVHYLDDYYLRRQVRTGRTAGDLVEIVDGLAPGQTIAASGAFLLKSDVLRSKMGEGCAH